MVSSSATQADIQHLLRAGLSISIGGSMFINGIEWMIYQQKRIDSLGVAKYEGKGISDLINR